LGLGLLTKATFLAFAPVIFFLVAFVATQTRSLIGVAGIVSAFTAIFVTLGAYKYADNYRHFRNPFINNIDPGASWVIDQQMSYKGLQSYVDFNFYRLLMAPSIDPEASPEKSQSDVRGSYPLLLYGSFWYPLFEHINDPILKYLEPAVYIAALMPTGAFLLGVWLGFFGMIKLITRFDYTNHEHRRLIYVYTGSLIFIANFGLLLAVLMKYHVWSIMQGRLLFPSIVGALGTFGAGATALLRTRISALTLKGSMYLLIALFGVYFLLSAERAAERAAKYVIDHRVGVSAPASATP
jgi:hypothetical protein